MNMPVSFKHKQITQKNGIINQWTSSCKNIIVECFGPPEGDMIITFSIKMEGIYKSFKIVWADAEQAVHLPYVAMMLHKAQGFIVPNIDKAKDAGLHPMEKFGEYSTLILMQKDQVIIEKFIRELLDMFGNLWKQFGERT
jgi:hypothetical protein